MINHMVAVFFRERIESSIRTSCSLSDLSLPALKGLVLATPNKYGKPAARLPKIRQIFSSTHQIDVLHHSLVLPLYMGT